MPSLDQIANAIAEVMPPSTSYIDVQLAASNVLKLLRPRVK